jgi:hypothetical protein
VKGKAAAGGAAGQAARPEVPLGLVSLILGQARRKLVTVPVFPNYIWLKRPDFSLDMRNDHQPFWTMYCYSVAGRGAD